MRFFFAYGDTNLATLQTKNYAGIPNPAATLGSEIPDNAPLKVWKGSDGRSFRLSIMAVRLSGHADSVLSAASVMATYDRVSATSSVTTLPNESTFLDKKLAFGGTTPSSSVTNFATLPAYNANGSIRDDNEDGIVDVLPLTPFSRVLRPQFTGDTSSPRGVGLSVVAAFNPAGVYFKVGYTPVRLFDITLRTNLSPFETYNGLGLQVHNGSGNPNNGSTSWLGPSNTPNNVGASITVQAVPEPGTAAAILAGFATLRFRRNRR